jgi:hypothetical protein
MNQKVFGLTPYGQVGICTRGLYHAKVAIFQLIYLPSPPE